MSGIAGQGRAQIGEQQFWRLIEIGIALSAEKNTSRLFESILDEAQSITGADGGTLYLVKEKDGHLFLEFEILRNDSLGLRLGGTSGNPIRFAPLPLHDPVSGEPNHYNISTHVALTQEMVNIEDAYDVDNFDFSGTKAFDQKAGYRSRSFLTVPLCNRGNETIGVLQLVNARDPHTGETIPFSADIEPIIAALSSFAAVALDNQILLQDHKDLLDAFIKVIAQAIDAKSKHTSLHCQRVPALTELIAQAACEAEQGPLADFSLDDAGWYELRVASWMHDCGKLSTPDSVLDKSTKLHLIRDGIEDIRTRFVVVMRDAELDYLRQVAREPQHADVLMSEFERLRNQLKEDCAFVEQSNRGGEAMLPESKERLQRIAQYRWRDCHNLEQPLLTEEELGYLCIERGTLTGDEREVINNHMVVTIQMLESLPFPKNLKRVPEYAGGHHEKMDGTGFPRGLTREQMSWPARMMAIADIFEALTASERPYKAPMKISQALSILRRMRDQAHIDPDLFELFLEERVWEKYAREFLKPDQLDVDSIEAYR